MLILPPIDLPPTAPISCEEWICGEAQERAFDARDPAVRGGFEGFCPEYRDTKHFRIHYATDGEHALPGWPDPAFLDDLATMLEDTLRDFHENLELPIPPSDGSLGGGDGLIDCYCWDFDSSRSTWAGFARRLDFTDTGCQYSMFGLMCLNISRLEGRSSAYVRKIAAHELFHLVQYGISGAHDYWFAESTAEWASDRGSPSDPIYLHANLFLGTPFLSLYHVGNRIYGARLFWDALDRFVAPSLTLDILRGTCEQQEIEVLESALGSRGFSLTEVLSHFAEWNAFTGSRDDGEHYTQGATLTDVSMQAEHTSFPVIDAAIDPRHLARNAGSNYIRFTGPGKRSGLRIEVHGSESASSRRIISVLAKDSHGQRRIAEVAPDANGFASLTIPGWGNVDDLTMIVTNGFPEIAEDDLTFTYSAIPTDGPFPSLELEAATPLAVFPNPAPGISTIQFQVSERGETYLAVFDVAGRRIVELANDTLEPGVYRSRFEMPRESGVQPSAGVYFVRLETGGTSVSEKVTVLRTR